MTEEKTQQEKDHKQLLVLLHGLQPTRQLCGITAHAGVLFSRS